MLFADLDISSADPLFDTISNINYREAEVVYHQGGDPAALYSLRTGVVKLSMVSRSGDVRIVRLLGPGSVLGLEVQQNLPYHHTAEPITEVNLCRLPVDAIRKIAAQQPMLYEGMLRQWNEQTELADSYLLNLSMGIIKDRVMALLQLLDDLCRKGGGDLCLPGNKDCADILGTRVESVSRVMAELKRAGVLQPLEGGAWQLSRAEAGQAD